MDPIIAFDVLLQHVPQQWYETVVVVIAACTVIAAFLPAPREDSHVVYKGIYKFVQWLAFNFCKAKNAQTTRPSKSETQHDRTQN